MTNFTDFMATVINYMSRMAHKWDFIGYKLGQDSLVLQLRSSEKSVSQRLNMIIDEWLRGTTAPSGELDAWIFLANVLKSPAVNLGALAKTIQQTHIDPIRAAQGRGPAQAMVVGNRVAFRPNLSGRGGSVFASSPGASTTLSRPSLEDLSANSVRDHNPPPATDPEWQQQQQQQQQQPPPLPPSQSLPRPLPPLLPHVQLQQQQCYPPYHHQQQQQQPLPPAQQHLHQQPNLHEQPHQQQQQQHSPTSVGSQASSIVQDGNLVLSGPESHALATPLTPGGGSGDSGGTQNTNPLLPAPPPQHNSPLNSDPSASFRSWSSVDSDQLNQYLPDPLLLISDGGGRPPANPSNSPMSSVMSSMTSSSSQGIPRAPPPPEVQKVLDRRMDADNRDDRQCLLRLAEQISSWKPFALELNLPMNKIDEIEAASDSAYGSKATEVLFEWLKASTTGTRSTLVEVLRTVRLHNLADELRYSGTVRERGNVVR